MLTLTYGETFSVYGAPAALEVSSAGSSTIIAAANEKNTDRTSTIARLRALLSQDDTDIVPHASVEEEQEAEPPQTEPSDESEESTETALKRCATPDDAAHLARIWPLSDVFVIVKDGSRSIVHIVKEANVSAVATTSSSSAPAVSIQPLLDLSLYPVAHEEKACVPSEVVGVTGEGSLLFNTDAHLYLSYNSESLVGYARDGFPIYGAYTGQVDECGGYQHSTGYRYSVSPDRNFILGCYAGAPASFVTQ